MDLHDSNDDTVMFKLANLAFKSSASNHERQVLTWHSSSSINDSMLNTWNIHLNYDWNYTLIARRASGIVLDYDWRLLWTMTRYKRNRNTALDYGCARIDFYCASSIWRNAEIPCFIFWFLYDYYYFFLSFLWINFYWNYYLLFYGLNFKAIFRIKIYARLSSM